MTCTAKEALEDAEAIMKAQTKKQAIEYFGTWNELVLFLEEKVREEAKNETEKTSSKE